MCYVDSVVAAVILTLNPVWELVLQMKMSASVIKCVIGLEIVVLMF